MIKVSFVCDFLNKNNKAELWAWEFFSDKVFKLPIVPQIGMEVNVDDFLDDEYLREVIDKLFNAENYSFGTRAIRRIVIFESHLDLHLA